MPASHAASTASAPYVLVTAMSRTSCPYPPRRTASAIVPRNSATRSSKPENGITREIIEGYPLPAREALGGRRFRPAEQGRARALWFGAWRGRLGDPRQGRRRCGARRQRVAAHEHHEVLACQRLALEQRRCDGVEQRPVLGQH